MVTRALLIAAAALTAGGILHARAEAAWTACVANVQPGDVLNVRERPTARSPVVGIFRRDACGIRIESCEGGWCRTENHEFSGYVSRSYLRAEAAPQAACGWYVSLGCSRSQDGAARILDNFGGEGAGGDAGAHVVRNDELPNFTPGWWCVVDGPYRKRGTADDVMWGWREAAPDAYVRSGC